MSFSFSSGVITQTGTDTSLAGLAGLSGVTVTTLAGASGSFQGVKLYTVNSSTRLEVNGTLSHDPDSEILVLQRNADDRPLAINGTYNYGSSASFRGGTAYQAGCGLVIGGYLTGSQRQFRDTTAGIYVSETGTLNWKGATIQSGRSIISRGSLNIENAGFVPRCTSFSTKDYCPRIGFVSGAGSLDSVRVEGGSGHFFGVTLGTATLSAFQGLDVVGNTDFASVISPQPGDAAGFASQFLTVSDIQDLSAGNLYSARAWQSRLIQFENYAGGVNLKDQLSDKDSTDTAARGAVLATKQVSATFSTSAGVPVEGAKFYIIEASDGNEPSPAVTGEFTAGDISYLEGPQSFTLTSGASGETSAAKLAIYFGYKMDASPMIDNVRTINSGNTVQASWYSYPHQTGSKEVTVSGKGNTVEAITLVPDLSVTEPNEAVALAYTTQETSPRAYDHLKALGQGETYATISGDRLNAGSYDVVIDGTGSGPATVVGNTITLNASVYTGDMTTTGIITLANGAQFIGTRTDANGTIAPPLIFTVSGYTAGARVFVYNQTKDAVVYNDMPGGLSVALESGFEAGDALLIRSAFTSATRHATASTVAVAASASFSALLVESDDDVYASNGVDGSTVTGIAYDVIEGGDNEIDLLLGADFRGVDLYAWYCYSLTGALGISVFFGAVTALDEANIRANVSLYLDNTTSTNIRQLDNVRLYRFDGAYPVKKPTSGGGGIDPVWMSKVYIAKIDMDLSKKLDEIYRLLGLDAANPVTHTPTSQVAGNITLSITGDGETTSTVTRINE